jgi:ribosomal protein S18 acetylase RimI-like enzyme
MSELDLAIRAMEEKDIPVITQSFADLGWNKPAQLYQRYLMEQTYERREVLVAFANGQFAGYLTICWKSTYPPFREKNIPEIVDFNVLPAFRRMGAGTQLMDAAEDAIARVGPMAGIGVGMTPDYGAAQRLYVLRGYIPNGLGLHWREHHVRYGEHVIVDDDLAIYLTKELK